MRAFLAVPLPADVRQTVAGAARLFPGLASQRPGTIHLTLFFLAEVADLAPVIAAVAPVVASHVPFEFEVAGLGAFPKRSEARVVWAGLSKGGFEAGILAAGVESALVPLGFPREARAWKGHVTIGRFVHPKRLPKHLFESAMPFGVARADRVILYESTLTPEGAIHEPRAEMPLGAG